MFLGTEAQVGIYSINKEDTTFEVKLWPNVSIISVDKSCLDGEI